MPSPTATGFGSPGQRPGFENAPILQKPFRFLDRCFELPCRVHHRGKDVGRHCAKRIDFEQARRQSFIHSHQKSTLNKTPNYKQQKKRREDMQKKKNEEKQRQHAARRNSDLLLPKP